jgi:hypothetical protein
MVSGRPSSGCATLLHVTVTPPDNLELIRRVLGQDYLQLAIKHLSVEEDAEVQSTVKITVIDGSPVEIEGHGVGVVDAIYNALLDRFSREYQSLKTIALAGFTVDADVETKKGKAGVDAVGKVTIDVINSEGRRFTFSDSSAPSSRWSSTSSTPSAPSSCCTRPARTRSTAVAPIWSRASPPSSPRSSRAPATPK